MADRIPAPEDVGDLRSTVLPARACLLALRDTSVPARRGALADALAAARKATRKQRPPDEQSALALAAIWEAVACLELAALVAAPWVDPQVHSEHGSWAELTVYDPGRANRFYESSHRWSDERFGTLSSHTFRHGGEGSLRGALLELGIIDAAQDAAFAEAEAATAAFLRRRFVDLARWWSAMRGYASAFEHGLLLVPAEIGAIIDAQEREIPHAIVIFETRRDGSYGAVGDSVNGAISAALAAGELALDLAEHVISSRLGIIEALEFDGDEIYLRQWDNAFPFWFERGAVSESAVELLGDGVRFGWREGEEAQPVP